MVKQNLDRIVRSILFLAVVVLLNIAGTTFFFRFDLTRNRIYTLSDASKNAVATLQEPLTIKVFFSKNLPFPYNSIEQQIRDLLEEYARWGNQYFNYSFYPIATAEESDPQTLSEAEETARSSLIFPIQIEKVERDEVKLIRAYMGLAFQHGDLLETIPAVTSTDQLEFRITRTIQALNERVSSLVNLQEDIRVELFLSSSLFGPADILSGIPAEVEQIVRELNRTYFGRLRFSYLDPASEPALIDRAALYGVPPILVGDQPAFAGLIVRLGEEVFGASLIQEGEAGVQVATVESMTAMIEDSTKAILGIQEEIGYMAGFGTPPYRGSSGQSDAVETDLRNFYPLVSRNYEIKGLLLERRAIPESLNSLLVVSPREKLSEWVQFQIDQLLMRGGSVLLFLDPFDIYIDRSPGGALSGQPLYLPRETGLEQMIEHYGVRMSASFVLDENCYVSREQNQRGGIDEVPIYFAPLMDKDNFNPELAYLKNLAGLITLSTAPLAHTRTEDEELKAHDLFSSSEQAWEMNYDDILRVNPINAQPPRSGQRSYPLAYLLEGKFTSYFAGRPLPDRPSFGETGREVGATFHGQSMEQPFLPEGRGKLFVMGSSTLLEASLLDPDGRGPNSLFLLNLLDVMNDRAERAVMRVKGGGLSPIDETTARQRTVIKTFNIAVLPALVAAAGALVWLYRGTRKRRILRRFEAATAAADPKHSPRPRRRKP